MGTKTDSSNRANHLRLALRMAQEAENIGGRIRELRNQQGMTQRAFAELLPGSTEGKDVSRWENGRHRPSADTLSHIADLLGTTVADLHAGPMSGRAEADAPPTGSVATSGPASSAVLAELERTAAIRHSEVMTELGRLRAAVEALGTRERQDVPTAAGQ